MGQHATLEACAQKQNRHRAKTPSLYDLARCQPTVFKLHQAGVKGIFGNLSPHNFPFCCQRCRESSDPSALPAPFCPLLSELSSRK